MLLLSCAAGLAVAIRLLREKARKSPQLLSTLSLDFSKRPQKIRTDLSALKRDYELQVQEILKSGTNFQNTFGRLADADGHAALASAGSFLMIKLNLKRILIELYSIWFCSPHITRIGFRRCGGKGGQQRCKKATQTHVVIILHTILYIQHLHSAFSVPKLSKAYL